MSKECRKCKQTFIKPENHFRVNLKSKDGFYTYCRECSNEMNRFTKDKNKKPKEKRECENKKCNKTFETRIDDKKYCCNKCAAYSNNQKRSKDLEYRFKYNFKNKFKVKKMEKPKEFKQWSKEEDGLLLNMKFDKLTFWEIADKMGRSYYAVGQRHRMLVKKLQIKGYINE